MTIDEIHPPAELAFQLYQKDKGSESLIAWFQAELSLRDGEAKSFYTQFSKAQLLTHEFEVEYLASSWRTKRLTAKKINVV